MNREELLKELMEPRIPISRIKQLRVETRQLQLLGYATVDEKRQIASRAVLELIDNMIKEYESDVEQPDYVDYCSNSLNEG